MKQEIRITADVGGRYEIVGAVYMRNVCCKDMPVIVVKSKGFYSCQCGCGVKCTGGYWKPEEAILEYSRMGKW